MSNVVRHPGDGLAGIIAAVAAFMLAGVVASGCTEADPEGFGFPAESEPSDRTLEPAGAPPGTPLFAEVLSVTDAAAIDGTWFVLDGRAQQVHRISPEGEPVQSFGREGSGPGEFRRASAIVAHGDSILVVGDGIVHVFSPRGRHIADRRLQPGPSFDCLAATMRITDAVAVRAGLLLLVECSRTDGGRTTHAAIEAGDGTVRSLAHRNLEPKVLDLSGMFTVIARHPRGFLFGSASDRCLDLFDPSGRKLDAICPDWLERPDFPREVARELEGTITDARRVGIRVRLPDALPPFVGVSVMAGGRLVYQVFAPGDPDMETFQLETLGETGQAVALPVPRAPILFQDGTSVMAAWEELEGTRIAIHTLDDLDAN